MPQNFTAGVEPLETDMALPLTPGESKGMSRFDGVGLKMSRGKDSKLNISHEDTKTDENLWALWRQK